MLKIETISSLQALTTVHTSVQVIFYTSKVKLKIYFKEEWKILSFIWE